MNAVSNIIFNYRGGSLIGVIPSRQLLYQSLKIIAGKKFKAWSKDDHHDSYNILQHIAQLWKNNSITDQCLIYGKVDSKDFSWEIVPCQSRRTWLGRIIQQLTVLWRIVFGGVVVSKENSEKQIANYQAFLRKSPSSLPPADIQSKGLDAFCKDEVIDSQCVFSGKKVNVLFNYGPIGLGGERLHFLVVPKQHRQSFTDITENEYDESMELTAKLVNYFMETRKTSETVKRADNVYLLHKTGIDAGQTVKHWHLHVICSTNRIQDFLGKMTVAKNILLGGASPMDKNDLAKIVEEFKKELAPVFNP